MREVYSSVDECYAKELAESFARDEKVQLMRDRIKAYAHQPLATAPRHRQIARRDAEHLAVD